MDEPPGAEDPTQALSIDDRLFEYRPFVPPDGTGALGAIDRWRRRTAAGAVLASVARGLQQVFDPERKERVVIEQEAPARPDDPEPVELHFDPESPRASFVVLRPWLRERRASGRARGLRTFGHLVALSLGHRGEDRA